MAEITNMNINNLVKMITIKVTISGYRKYNLKMYIGKLLIKYGLFIMGVNSEIKNERLL